MTSISWFASSLTAARTFSIELLFKLYADPPAANSLPWQALQYGCDSCSVMASREIFFPHPSSPVPPQVRHSLCQGLPTHTISSILNTDLSQAGQIGPELEAVLQAQVSLQVSKTVRIKNT
jgi:hypothetical protein